jgi:ribonuclease J
MERLKNILGIGSETQQVNNSQANPLDTQSKQIQNTFDRAPLKIIPIGGTTTVQKNMYVYECGNDIIVVDCGIGFPDWETPGIDIIIPDFSYVLENRHRVKGVLITHGHNDHISAIPYLLKEHPFKVYAVPFVKDLIEQSLKEFKNLGNAKVTAFDPDKPLQLGVFRINAFRVNHSIPDTMGFAIDTPQGRVFHCADYKFDWAPFIGKPFDVQKAAYLAREFNKQPLAMLSDSLGSTTEGFTDSEKHITSIFDEIMEKSIDRQVFITTVSSNVSRIQQAIESSIKHGRKLVFSGRSINENIEIAIMHGYIKCPENMVIPEHQAMRHNQSKLTYIITGSYGQANSSLYRVLNNEHKYISFKKNPVVVYSADPIPSSINAINTMIDHMFLAGVEVFYSQIQDNLHVSGHGGKGDLTLLANLIKPKYYIPIGGNIKHMRAYAQMIADLGNPKENVIELLDGQAVIFENGQARLGEKLKLREVYVDGNIVGDVGASVIEDRIKMSSDGIVIVITNKQEIDIVTRGFVFAKTSKGLIDRAKAIASKLSKDKIEARKIEYELSKFFFKETGRNPIVIVN